MTKCARPASGCRRNLVGRRQHFHAHWQPAMWMDEVRILARDLACYAPTQTPPYFIALKLARARGNSMVKSGRKSKSSLMAWILKESQFRPAPRGRTAASACAICRTLGETI